MNVFHHLARFLAHSDFLFVRILRGGRQQAARRDAAAFFLKKDEAHLTAALKCGNTNAIGDREEARVSLEVRWRAAATAAPARFFVLADCSR